MEDTNIQHISADLGDAVLMSNDPISLQTRFRYMNAAANTRRCTPRNSWKGNLGRPQIQMR